MTVRTETTQCSPVHKLITTLAVSALVVIASASAWNIALDTLDDLATAQIAGDVQTSANAIAITLAANPDATLAQLATVDLGLDEDSRVSIAQTDNGFSIVGTSVISGASYGYTTESGEVVVLSDSHGETLGLLPVGEEVEAAVLVQKYYEVLSTQEVARGAEREGGLAVNIGVTSNGTKVFATSSFYQYDFFDDYPELRVRGWVDGYESETNLCMDKGCNPFMNL